MPASEISAAIEASFDGRRLLDHPFYRQWQEGLLSRPDLARYAEQYRHFERSLPQVLSAVADGLPVGTARELVELNLADESLHPEPHAALFEGFASAVGALAESAPSAATNDLIGVYGEAVNEGPVAALAVIAAYEVQAGDIAATKAASLEERYGLGSEANRFWKVHSEMEPSHAGWTTDALAELEADPKVVSHWSTRSARAWWSFLDERSECSTVAAG
jgi:pyrroloquinoline-quinone synthase